jgi:hypothetical protein
MAFSSFPIQSTPLTTAFPSYASSLTGTFSWGGQFAPKGLTFTNNLTFSGTQDPTQAWVWQVGALFGTATQPTSGYISPHQIFIGGDQVDTTTSGNGVLVGQNILHAASTNHTGGRIASQSYLAIVGTPAIAPGAAGYVGFQGNCRCNSNLTGTSGAYTNYAGAMFGGNSFVWAQSGATDIQIVNGHEFDCGVYSGATVAEKHGLTVVKFGSDAVRATYDDSAICINDQDTTSTTWQYGLQFGAYAHKWSFGTDSTLIFAQSRQSGPASTSVANYGIDFSNLTITSGGAGVVMPLITPSSSSATGKAGSIVWDTGFIYICTATNTWKRVALSSF